MNRLAPTLPTACGSLPPEGAAPPADWQSQIRGRNLDERGQACASNEVLKDVAPMFATPIHAMLFEEVARFAVQQSRSCGRSLNERGRHVPCLKL